MNNINVVLGVLMGLTSLDVHHFVNERKQIENHISMLENELFLLNLEKFRFYEIKKIKKNKEEIQTLKIKIRLEKKYLNEFSEIMQAFINSKSLKETIKLNQG